VYVLDWGIAKLAALDDASGAAPAITRTESNRQITVAGTTLGTPGYMAPEQIAASSAVDARADVFALGAVLFEILALEPLLDETAIHTRLRGQKATWDARPTARAPKLGIPPELDRICVRATAADPAERYPSARALHDDVEAYLDGVRDVSLRKQVASVHLARAEANRTKDRDEALRDVNRALAIAGEDRRALELLLDLLDTPSAAEAARAEVEAAGLVRHRGSQPLVLLFTIPWLTFYPMILWKRGAVNLPLALLPVVMWTAATVASFIARRRNTGATATYPVALFMLAIAASSVVLGPLLLLPSLATATLATHMLIQPRALRRATYVWAFVAVFLPMLPVWLGVSTPYSFPDEASVVLHPITRVMRATNLGVYLTVTDLAFVVGVAIFATRFRRQVDRARTERSVVAWQLSKLLPPAIDGLGDPPTGGGHESAPKLVVSSIASEPTALATTARPEENDDGAGPALALEGARYVESRAGIVHDRLIGRDVAMERSAGAMREALFQASVEHPFIPPIYDVGTDDAGPWFTTKLVRGRRLSDLVTSNEIPDTRGRHERLTALAKVCLTIEFAHSRGVVHAGLGPDHVVLGDFGEVYVLGWNHAKRHGELDPSADVSALGELLSAVAGADLPEALVKARYPSARSLHDALEAFLSADRDEELRRQLAAERLAKAERRAQRALENDDEAARVGALRELGRARALAPERSAPLRLLGRLLQKQPRTLPAEVKRDLEARIVDVSRKSSPVAALIYVVAFVVVFPIYSLVVGVREPAKVIAVVAAWLLASLVAVGQSRSQRPASIPWSALAAWVAVMVTSLVLGPWFMVPSLAIAVTMVYALAVQSRWRHPTIAMGALAVALPALPVLFGVSDVLALHGDVTPTFVLHGADYHPPGAFLFMLVAVNVASVLAAGIYAAQYRDRLDGLEAENRAKVHALSRLM
jgi:serine/threonine protein kinase